MTVLEVIWVNGTLLGIFLAVRRYVIPFLAKVMYAIENVYYEGAEKRKLEKLWEEILGRRLRKIPNLSLLSEQDKEKCQKRANEILAKLAREYALQDFGQTAFIAAIPIGQDGERDIEKMQEKIRECLEKARDKFWDTWHTAKAAGFERRCRYQEYLAAVGELESIREEARTRVERWFSKR
ncbi:MAG: hypothetical protein Q7R98_02495 [Candidatus Jorgensenbacteria bacterium]|nr:hypothetical protein [Candidatus Jorgensenbacteria bacterium]